jgi:hypothetical protein
MPLGMTNRRAADDAIGEACDVRGCGEISSYSGETWDTYLRRVSKSVAGKELAFRSPNARARRSEQPSWIFILRTVKAQGENA